MPADSLEDFFARLARAAPGGMLLVENDCEAIGPAVKTYFDGSGVSMHGNALPRQFWRAVRDIHRIIRDVRPDVVLSHDNTAAIVGKIGDDLEKHGVRRPEMPVIVLDHVVPAVNEKTAANHVVIREFVAAHGIENFYDVGHGICHQVVVEKGIARPGMVIVGSDSHTCSYGAVNCFSTGIDRTEAAALLRALSSLGIKELDYISAARAAGQGEMAIVGRHVLPNILSPLIVQATVQFAVAILAEAGLSYLGLGTQPPHPSWGRMLNEAQTFMELAPWMAIFPGLAIAWTVLGFNLLGDGLRDLLDPRLR